MYARIPSAGQDSNEDPTGHAKNKGALEARMAVTVSSTEMTFHQMSNLPTDLS